jgi:hypothetical protein
MQMPGWRSPPGLDRWEAHLRNGLIRVQAHGKLRKHADPAALATATMACLQGGGTRRCFASVT